MVNVLDNYKLIELEINGDTETVRINTSEAWNVLEFEVNGKKAVVNENNKIKKDKSNILFKI